jgi:glycosyltransferase involved in cell wall biosynthesis
MTPSGRAEPRRLVLTANQAWNLHNFRSGLIRRLLANGHEVIAVSPADGSCEKLRALGCRTVDVPISAKGTNPIEDAWLVVRLARIYRELSPDIVLHYTIKPNIYGSLAAAICGVPSIAVVTGLGFAFLSSGAVARTARALYRFALRFPREVWFLNGEDEREFVERGLVRASQSRNIPGEGIDTAHFAPLPERPPSAEVRFLMVARLLADKGVREFVQAARAIRAEHPTARFQLLGDAGVENPSAIGEAEVHSWERAGAIEYLGSVADVRPHVAAADCVVLPSYREGISRVLLEAASMARAIIASDVPGCRETVDDGVTGFVCKVRDADDLAGKMKRMLLLTPQERAAMGAAGRRKIVREFDERIVIEKYLRTIPELAQARIALDLEPT